MAPTTDMVGRIADILLEDHVEGMVKTKTQADKIEALEARVAELERLLYRYRHETPLGHQPHMIAHEVDAALAGKQTQEGE